MDDKQKSYNRRLQKLQPTLKMSHGRSKMPVPTQKQCSISNMPTPGTTRGFLPLAGRRLKLFRHTVEAFLLAVATFLICMVSSCSFLSQWLELFPTTVEAFLSMVVAIFFLAALGQGFLCRFG